MENIPVERNARHQEELAPHSRKANSGKNSRRQARGRRREWRSAAQHHAKAGGRSPCAPPASPTQTGGVHPRLDPRPLPRPLPPAQANSTGREGLRALQAPERRKPIRGLRAPAAGRFQSRDPGARGSGDGRRCWREDCTPRRGFGGRGANGRDLSPEPIAARQGRGGRRSRLTQGPAARARRGRRERSRRGSRLRGGAGRSGDLAAGRTDGRAHHGGEARDQVRQVGLRGGARGAAPRGCLSLQTPGGSRESRRTRAPGFPQEHPRGRAP